MHGWTDEMGTKEKRLLLGDQTHLRRRFLHIASSLPLLLLNGAVGDGREELFVVRLVYTLIKLLISDYIILYALCTMQISLLGYLACSHVSGIKQSLLCLLSARRCNARPKGKENIMHVRVARKLANARAQITQLGENRVRERRKAMHSLLLLLLILLALDRRRHEKTTSRFSTVVLRHS